jgi:hypothetical protein
MTISPSPRMYVVQCVMSARRLKVATQMGPWWPGEPCDEVAACANNARITLHRLIAACKHTSHATCMFHSSCPVTCWWLAVTWGLLAPWQSWQRGVDSAVRGPTDAQLTACAAALQFQAGRWPLLHSHDFERGGVRQVIPTQQTSR